MLVLMWINDVLFWHMHGCMKETAEQKALNLNRTESKWELKLTFQASLSIHSLLAWPVY